MNSLIHIFHSHASARVSTFRKHRHTAFELSLILHGEGNYLSGGINYPIKSGDIFLYNTNEAHCITDITTADGMEILNIHFEPRYFWNTPSEVHCLQSFFLRSQRHDNRIPADSELNASLREHILSCDRENETREREYEMSIRIHLLSIFVLLARTEPETETVLTQDFDENQLFRINHSMDYICNHYAESITLEQLAKLSGFGKTYYSTLFKRLNGMTPWEYLMIKRVEGSMRMLRTTSETVLNIALSNGFNNTANFNRVFRNVTGMTPREYKRSNRI